MTHATLLNIEHPMQRADPQPDPAEMQRAMEALKVCSLAVVCHLKSAA